MHLMRCLTFIMAKYNFVASGAHIHNDLAEALSRNNSHCFLSHYPQAQQGCPRASGTLSNLSARLGLASLDQAVEQSALAPTSQRTYASAQQRYVCFCISFGLAPLPVQFASHLANETLAHSTIKGYLSAIRHLQRASGFPDPATSNIPKLEWVIKGIKSTQARAQSSKHTRHPITPHIVKAMGAVWEAQGHHVMLWAAVTLCFFGFLRSGEVILPSDYAFDPATHLTFDDIIVDDITKPTLLKLRLKASKTDPFRKGVDIVVGKTNNKLRIPRIAGEWPRLPLQIQGWQTPH